MEIFSIILPILAAVIIYLLSRTESKDVFKNGYIELKFTSGFIWFMVFLFSILPILILISLFLRGGTKDMIGFGVLLLFFISADLLCFILLKKDKVYFGTDGILKRRAFRKDIFIAWEETINITYSHILKHLVFKKISGEKIRINIAMSGFKNFCEKIPSFIPDGEFKRQIYIASQANFFT